jgi:hypothetical protein
MFVTLAEPCKPVESIYTLAESNDQTYRRSSKEVAMQSSKTYVCADEHSVMRVGNARVMLDSIVASFEQGYSPETIQQQYPALTLEEVYGAIAWYLANASEVSQYLKRQQEVWNHWRTQAEAQPSSVIQRLRVLQAHHVSETP